MELKRIQDVEVSGARVLLRASLNVPVGDDGQVLDTFRLQETLRTIRYLSSRGARTTIIGHLGRDGRSLEPVARALGRLAPDIPLGFAPGPLPQALGKAASLNDGECIVLENVRHDPREEAGDPALAAELSKFGDLFVNDAFADSHRAHASIVGIARLLPSYAGLSMQDEVSALSEALTPPPGAAAFIGGVKFETKEPVIQQLLPRYERLYVVGGMADTFLKARGLEVGRSIISPTTPSAALLGDARIAVQTDVVVRKGGASRTSGVDAIGADEQIVDIGPATAAAWSEDVVRRPFILWNGPLGIYEEGFGQGTRALAEAIAKSDARAVVGGGDTIAAIEGIAFDRGRVFLSTGGGAMLQFLADGTLAGIEPLKAAVVSEAARVVHSPQQ